MKYKFPTFDNKNIALYYLLTIFLNGWFILPNWVFYFAQFIRIPQIAFIDGISKLVAVFLEVPSGAVADLLGKRETLIFGNIAFIICNLVLINASNFTWLLIGNMIMFVGFAFVSGAKEAILYDSLVDIYKQEHYDEVLGKVNSIAMATTIFSIFVGGLLYRFDPRLTFLAWMIFNVIAITLLILMKEPVADEKHLTYGNYLAKLKDGVASIFSKPVISFVLPVLFFSMLFRAYEGVIRQNTGAYFGFTGESFGYMLALISIPTLLVSYNYHKIVAFLKHRVEYVFISLYLIGFLLIFLTNNLLLGICSFLAVYAAQEIAKPYVISLINKNIESHHRATSLSTVSLFAEFPYMITTIFLGSLLELGMIKYLYLGFIGCLVIYSLIRRIGAK